MHERCKTGECSVTTATLCTTPAAAGVGTQRHTRIDDPHPEQKLRDDARESGCEREEAQG